MNPIQLPQDVIQKLKASGLSASFDGDRLDAYKLGVQASIEIISMGLATEDKKEEEEK